MKIKISFSPLPSLKGKNNGTLVLTVADDKKLHPFGQSVDKALGGAVVRALNAGRFAGKKGQCLSLESPASLGFERIVVLGLGKEKSLSELALQSAGGSLLAHLNNVGAKAATVAVELHKGKINAADAAALLAYGAGLRSYRFDKYRTKEKQEDKPTLAAITFALSEHAKAVARFGTYEKLIDAVFFTRDVVSEPANVIYPASFAERAQDLKKLGVQVEVLGVKEMQKLGMGALLGVGQGSARESKLLVMRYNGGKKGDAPLAFIGKGVTFDTGGISIKPANGMEEMKWDMAGAGVVTGLMRALAARKAKVNVVCVAGLVENMPDGNAQRPGDVVTSMSGQTIEVINTDAEGRLVLADALWYTKERFKPKFMINLATLTGAIIVALGTSRAGLFSNNDKLAERLFDLGKRTGEEVWRLPLAEVYDKQINSYIADMQNVGEGREAGSITAAQFLQRFVGDTPWAHLDIAGVAWTNKGWDIAPKGATAFGVRLLNELVAEHYE